MNNVNQIIMSSLLNKINEANLNNRSTVNRNMGQNSNSFDSILKNSLGQSNSCSCNKTNQLGILTTMVGALNSLKINNESMNNNNIDNLTSTANSAISSETITSTNMDEALKLLEKQIGKPYVWGANGPKSFDCSGLTRYIYKEALGKDIPRTSYSQSNFGQEVDKKDLQPGDLVFFDTMGKGKVSHVGIYTGNNEFIHASNKRDGVKKSSLESSYYQKSYKGARRP